MGLPQSSRCCVGDWLYFPSEGSRLEETEIFHRFISVLKYGRIVEVCGALV